MVCSFTNQVLAQLDSLRSWKETTAYKKDPHLLPIQLNEKVTNLHPPALGKALDVPTQEQANFSGVKVQGPFKSGHHVY